MARLMAKLKSLEIVPSAAALIDSLRGFGYSPETALADLVDNSISAEADQIHIDLGWNDGSPRVTLHDNGKGMTAPELSLAMCFGGTGPGLQRQEGDLGRFGLGLKTASLSQCRCMIVVTRKSSRTAALSWDLDDVQQTDKWRAIIPIPPIGLPPVAKLLKATHGTTVIWERMDALSGLSGLDREHFFLKIRDISAYLAMIFHRFLSGDAKRITLKVNGRTVEGWDPFERGHPATITMQSEPIRFAGATVRVAPYVLPHRDRYKNDAEFERAGGVGGWSERQGFYVYRKKRLLVPGGWLGLGGSRAWTREESSRLARISVDIDGSLDTDWCIDVRKSQARPPGPLRSRLTMLATICREKAREVFVYRGQRTRSKSTRPDDELVWIPAASGVKTAYRLNRAHPAIASASKQGDSQLVLAMLALIERTVPVRQIWLDVGDAEGAAEPPMNPEEMAVMAEQIVVIIKSMSTDIPVAEQVDRLVRHLPTDADRIKISVLKLIEKSYE